VTKRLADFAGLWCDKLPVAHVCKLTGLHWETVRRIERRRLATQLNALPEAQPTKLVMDEFALFGAIAMPRWYSTAILGKCFGSVKDAVDKRFAPSLNG
jgi:predicted Abi (CAAX) family protease